MIGKKDWKTNQKALLTKKVKAVFFKRAVGFDDVDAKSVKIASKRRVKKFQDANQSEIEEIPLQLRKPHLS